VEGAGAGIGLAVAGIVAAGVGLVTMHTAFKPLPTPGVPVVISHSVVAPTAASWRHAPGARPAARPVSVARDEDAAAPEPRIRTISRHVHAEALPPVAAEPPAQPAPAKLSAAPPRPQVQTVAKAETTPDKLCKAPSPQLLSAKALQPAMILRYDARFKASTPDIAPPRPPASDDEQRQLKLSALLANIMGD